MKSACAKKLRFESDALSKSTRDLFVGNACATERLSRGRIHVKD